MLRRAFSSICAVRAIVVRSGGVLIVAALLISMLGSALPTADAQEAPNQETPNQETSAQDVSSPGPDAVTYSDDDLHQALTAAGLVDAWIQASGISASASLVEVLGDEDYRIGRLELLNQLDRFTERHSTARARAARTTQLTANVGALEALIRSLRRDATSTSHTPAVSLTPHVVEQARTILAAIDGNQRWLGLSLDPLDRLEHRIAAARDAVRSEVDQLSIAGHGQKHREAAVARLTWVYNDLQQVASLIEAADQQLMIGRSAFVAAQDAIVDTFPELHRLRLLRPSSVGGLSVVTVDAYVRGADDLDASCPVDWALLAGIGRVESRHGTIDDTSVQATGRVTADIFGPLLDGGATEREAIQAEADAIAAAEEAALLAALEPEEPPEPTFDESLWGDAVERAKAIEESIAIDDGVGRAAPPELEAEDTPPARFDPLLWGDDLPFSDEDLDAPNDADIADADGNTDEEPEFKGNGFAVIADSDNGRLDGNNRWDRAVGPMQFIPETWAYWETDGNDDGVIDPQNLYDAAATAGQFLCHLSGTRGSSPYSFVLGYNSSQTYVRNVMAVADAFGSNELPTVAEPANN